MKKHFLLIPLLFLFACNTSRKVPKQYKPVLFQHWIHSYEEDETDIRVYRPAGFDFPPSRGREGFEIKENGEYIRHAIGPNDVPVKTAGTWKMKGKSSLLITFPDSKDPTHEMKIRAVSKEKLSLTK